MAMISCARVTACSMAIVPVPQQRFTATPSFFRRPQLCHGIRHRRVERARRIDPPPGARRQRLWRRTQQRFPTTFSARQAQIQFAFAFASELDAERHRQFALEAAHDRRIRASRAQAKRRRRPLPSRQGLSQCGNQAREMLMTQQGFGPRHIKVKRLIQRDRRPQRFQPADPVRAKPVARIHSATDAPASAAPSQANAARPARRLPIQARIQSRIPARLGFDLVMNLYRLPSRIIVHRRRHGRGAIAAIRIFANQSRFSPRNFVRHFFRSLCFTRLKCSLTTEYRGPLRWLTATSTAPAGAAIACRKKFCVGKAMPAPSPPVSDAPMSQKSFPCDNACRDRIRQHRHRRRPRNPRHYWETEPLAPARMPSRADRKREHAFAFAHDFSCRSVLCALCSSHWICSACAGDRSLSARECD